METFFIILVILSGFYLLWNIGANDVANAVGTSIGSGAITLKKAILITAILEFAGAFLVGSNVSETIQSGIINPSSFAKDPFIFILGMFGALLSTAIWLNIATYFKWPVSTTHAIVGALMGFGIVIAGVSDIHWEVVSSIVASWIISPGISAIIAFILFTYIQRNILYAYQPLRAAKKNAPYLVFIAIATFSLSTLVGGLKNLNFIIPLPYVITFSFSLALFSFFISKLFIRRIKEEKYVGRVAENEHLLYSLSKALRHISRARLTADEKIALELKEMENRAASICKDLSEKTKTEALFSTDYQMLEKIFAYLQIITACFVAFAHGANDVANAIGPVAAILHTLANPGMIAAKTNVPTWLLAFGGFGIVVGLATYGWRVIETIGKKITYLTPTRGFSAEFAAASTILVASKLGLPISTTHAIVGAVLGIGLAKGVASLNLRTIKEIFMSWIITIPSAAILSVGLFYLLKILFL